MNLKYLFHMPTIKIIYGRGTKYFLEILVPHPQTKIFTKSKSLWLLSAVCDGKWKVGVFRLQHTSTWGTWCD